MSNDKKFDINDETYINEQIDAINSMINRSNYASLQGLSVNLTGERSRKINKAQIRRALDSPLASVNILQRTSSMLKKTNGIYQEILDYQSNMLTNDHMLIPISVDKIKTKIEMAEILTEQSLFLSKYNVKYNTNWIIKRVLEQGELYIYKLETADGIVLQEIPASFCKITRKYNNVFRFAINLNNLNDNIIIYMPKEIQLAYKNFNKNQNKKKNSIIDNSFYEVGENGIAFPLEENSTKCIPYYSTIFDDLIELEDKKDLKSQNDILSAIKLIHQKLPYDKETGKVLVNAKQATTIHNATKASLPKGTAIVTHQLDMDILNLSDKDSKLDESIDQATEQVFQNAGKNLELFNGKKNNTEAIVAGIVVDSLVPLRIQSMVANWINYELSKNKKKGVQFKIKFIESTHFNKDVKIKIARDNMSSGGSQLEFLATQGYEPNDGLSLLEMEKLLELDKLLIPKKTSHTLSKNDIGRPDKDTEINDKESESKE